MRTQQVLWSKGSGWNFLPQNPDPSAQILFVFGSPDVLKNPAPLDALKKAYPKAYFFGCSTAGEIYETRVLDHALTATAVHFEDTRLSFSSVKIEDPKTSLDAGKKLAQMLDKQDLVHVLVLSDGLKVNGSDLVLGLTQHLPAHVAVTGGLSGDGEYFRETLVFNEHGIPESGVISVVGLYGSRLRIGYGSLGGWDPFGPERLITRSEKNVLYELDGKSALELYKKYLGEHAQGLPATGLLFPLSLRIKDEETPVVRTILGIDEKSQSMTFAGTMPQGAIARFMKANFDRLIDGAAGAAKTSYASVGTHTPSLALLISCVGRKLILKQRVEEEIESVRDILGKEAALTGFYSYGEISPFTPGAKCELHNQTMTITTLSEAA